jgi:hypothetical protein
LSRTDFRDKKDSVARYHPVQDFTMTDPLYDYADDFDRASKIPIHGPLQMRTTPAGALEVLCYQQYGREVVPTVLQFVSDAAGQLVHDLYEGVRRGDIHLEILTPGNGIQ